MKQRLRLYSLNKCALVSYLEELLMRFTNYLLHFTASDDKHYASLTQMFSVTAYSSPFMHRR